MNAAGFWNNRVFALFSSRRVVMKIQKTDRSVARRDVLKLAPALGVAGTATAAGNTSEAPVEPPADPRQPRLANTKHVQTYYRLARS
jgi:hypothetical protein